LHELKRDRHKDSPLRLTLERVAIPFTPWCMIHNQEEEDDEGNSRS